MPHMHPWRQKIEDFHSPFGKEYRHKKYTSYLTGIFHVFYEIKRRQTTFIQIFNNKQKLYTQRSHFPFNLALYMLHIHTRHQMGEDFKFKQKRYTHPSHFPLSLTRAMLHMQTGRNFPFNLT